MLSEIEPRVSRPKAGAVRLAAGLALVAEIPLFAYPFAMPRGWARIVLSKLAVMSTRTNTLRNPVSKRNQMARPLIKMGLKAADRRSFRRACHG